MTLELAKVKSFQGCFGVLAGFFIFAQCLSSQDVIGPTTVLAQNHELTLEDYLQEVWKANELLQVQALGAAIADEQLEAEKAIFDPVFVGQFNALDEHRPNTAEQRVNLGYADVFNQRNKILQSGVEVLTPSGLRLQLGYDLSRMSNNLNSSSFPHGEYLSKVGITAVQPLLKGGGSVVTMAGIRAAAVNSDIGFQDYRKGMMEILGRAEIAYWNLYDAQEKFGITGESLRMAKELLKDSRIRLQLGKGTELELMQAEAGVALRDALRYEASSDLSVARSQLLVFLGRRDEGEEIVAGDKPIYHSESPKFMELWGKAYDSSPEFVALRKRVDLDGIKMVLARNAKLPQLDFTVGYAFSGIGSSAGDSFHAAEDHDYPSWSGGLQLRVPFMGDDKAEHELKAAQLRKKATELGLSNFTKELENSLRASIYTVESYRQNGDRYLKVIQFNEKVLDTQLASNEAGKSSSRDVLEAEEDLFEVKITGLTNSIRYQRALLELELLSGVLLSNRRLDISRPELRRRTAILESNDGITKEQYDLFLKQAGAEYSARMSRAKSAPTDIDTPVEPRWNRWHGVSPASSTDPNEAKDVWKWPPPKKLASPPLTNFRRNTGKPPFGDRKPAPVPKVLVPKAPATPPKKSFFRRNSPLKPPFH